MTIASSISSPATRTEVTFTTPDPELCTQLANTLVYQYSAFSSETESDMARKTTSFIREQIEKLQREIQERENQLQEYSQREDIVMMGEKENITIQQLEGLNASLTQARADRVNAEARYRSLQGSDVTTLPDVANDPGVQGLRSQRAALQKQYAELSSKFKPDWPDVQRTRSAIEELEQRIRQETKEVAGKALAAARVEYQSALKRESMFEQAVEEQKRQAQELNKITTDYNRIKVELDNQRNMLQQLLRRRSETDLTADLGERQPVNVRVVEEAVVPKRPSQPNLQRTLMMGVLLGISLAIGFAFFLDYWDTSIHTIEDLRRHVKLPYLGMVPRYAPEALPILESKLNLRMLPADTSEKKTRSSSKDLSRTRSSLALAARAETPSRDDSFVVGERFKFLRGSLLMSSPGTPPKTVLVTGPDKNAGKTFVACNLAVSLAELGKKVLLIDADLRKPRLSKVFNLRNVSGLSSYLAGKHTFDEVVQKTSIENIWTIPSGPHPPNPAELLNSRRMKDLLAEAKEKFTVVLLDTPPVLAVIDPVIVCSLADSTVFVVRAGKTTRRPLVRAVEEIRKSKADIIGVVFNEVRLGRQGIGTPFYHYYQYEYEAAEPGSTKPSGEKPHASPGSGSKS